MGETAHQDQPGDTTRSEAPLKQTDLTNSASSINKPENKDKSFTRKAWDAIRWFAIDQWFLEVLCILILISSQAPVPEARQSTKETVIDFLCVTIIFFINGCTISTRTLMKNLGRWKVHLFVQILSYLMCSAVVFAIVSAAASNQSFMDPALLVGMLVLGCLPTTIAFNVTMTKQAHGNAALTVAQSTIGNFLGPFLSPVLINLYISTGAYYDDFLPSDTGSYAEIYKRVFQRLGLTVFLPIVVGQVVQAIFPKTCTKLFTDYKLSKLGSLALLVIIWSTFDAAFASGAWETIPASNIVFLIFTCIGFFCSWFVLTFTGSMFWMPRVDTAAVVYCVPSKTPAMGVPLTHVMFLGLQAAVMSKLQIPMVIFQGLQVVLSSLSTIPLRKWVDRGTIPDEETSGSKGGPSKGDDTSTEESQCMSNEKNVERDFRFSAPFSNPPY